MSIAIKVEHLTKSYGANTVIKDVSFSVNSGEIFALLGTNGAGKTTTIECTLGLLKHEAGIITIDGKVGVQLQSSSFPDCVKTQEVYRLFCKWNNAVENHEQFTAFGLDKIKNKQYCHLSTGQKRRLHLALALIGNPDVIFLDEPTAGLDVEGRVSLHAEIRKLKQSGKTLIMASHDMAEVESLCDRLAIIKNGKIAFIGTSSELMAGSASEHTILIETENGVEQFVTTNISETLLTQLALLKQQNIVVRDVRVERATLEQRFIEIATED